MESLVVKFRGLLESVDTTFTRNLYTQINWKARGIRIDGARGVGKSTLMLQQIKNNLPVKSTLYITLDDLYFRSHTLTEVAEEFYQQGGRHLFLDEVHKYAHWQTEVKNLFDFKKQLQIVMSGSSILALQRSQVDLSRRVINYLLPGLSFREYLGLKHGIHLPTLELKELVSGHEEIAESLLKKIPSPLAKYRHYIQFGVYPFFTEGEADYFVRINQLINVIIDYDLIEARAMEGSSLGQLKKLLYIISRSVPFTPNTNKLAEDLGIGRARILDMLHILEKAQLIRNLRSTAHGVSLMNKPNKIYLNNTNLIHALADGKPEKGNIRETLFYAHIQDARLSVSYPKAGDFLVQERYTFEVGGKDKSYAQIKGVKDSFVVADDLERGVGNKIPLWLFGFLF
jgi:predicted AAA+ superfamily ATPase